MQKTDEKEGIVYIDPKTLSPTPDPVHVRSGNALHFYVTGGRGELQISFEPEAPVDQEGRDGAHAWARARKVSSSQKHKYTIILDGRRMDPEVMIDP